MKRFLLASALILFAVLVICASESLPRQNNSLVLEEEGIAPVRFNEDEKTLLDLLGLQSNTAILTFHAPTEGISLELNAYQLSENGWENIKNGGVSIGEQRTPIETLQGLLAITVNEDSSITVNLDCAGVAEYKIEPAHDFSRPDMSGIVFLDQFQTIEMNREVPIALIAYNDKTMPVLTVADYHDPSRLTDMELVQSITLTFQNTAK